MKNKLLLVFLFISLGISGGRKIFALDNNKFTINKECKYTNQNEIKTNLEIDKLKNDINNSNYAIRYQFFTIVCASVTTIISGLTMFFTIKNQNKTYKMARDQNRKQQVANYLSQLSSSDKTIKIGAIHALESYKEAFPYIINVLKNEEDYFVLNTVTTTLIKNPEVSLKLLIDESKAIRNEKIKLAGELLALDKSENEICTLLGINNEEFKEWKEHISFKDAKKQLLCKIDIKLRIGDSTQENICSAEEKNMLIKLYSLNNLLNRIVEITSSAIKNVSQLEENYSIKNAYLPKIQLSEVNLSNWDLSKVNLTDARLNRCTFNNTKFENTILKSTSFREGYFKNNKFNNHNMNNCDFSKCKIENVIFKDIEAYDMSFKGAEIISCNFKRCKYKGIKMQGAKFLKSNFNNIKFFTANFMNAEIRKKNIFQQVEFNGSRFDGAKNINTKFDDCKMFGVRLERSTYKECEFKNLEFKNINIFSNSNFQSNTYNTVKFYDGTAEFKQHIIEDNENIN